MDNKHGMPIITLNINDVPEQLVLDTGSMNGLHLTKAMMLAQQNLQIASKRQKFIDITGTIREQQTFTLSELKIGDITLQNISGVEFQP